MSLTLKKSNYPDIIRLFTVAFECKHSRLGGFVLFARDDLKCVCMFGTSYDYSLTNYSARLKEKTFLRKLNYNFKRAISLLQRNKIVYFAKLRSFLVFVSGCLRSSYLIARLKSARNELSRTIFAAILLDIYVKYTTECL